ncbi:hypothetical protein SAMN05660199_00188 [Klenkia soli]|uniref:Sensor histidine kinase n=1 Tax=Klenkia soli TaxID=1052260 RepID=A0A1H0C2I7_9ACTN|nr:hypothetical protein [Klenkia soli]SDN52101.1 hypothetical protein SAMN05660199_00188 [Klenkia soli]
MTSILRGVRPLDVVLATAMTALGVLLMVFNTQGSDDGTRIGSTSWLMVPVFAAATLPVLLRRHHLWAVLGVTAAALAVHDVAFGWVVRCGAGLPLSFALAYAAGRLLTDRRRSVAAVVAVVGIQFLVLVRDSAAGLDIIPVTAVIAAVFWGVGLLVQRRTHHVAAPVPATPAETLV